MTMKTDFLRVPLLLAALGGCVGGQSIPAPVEDRAYRPAAPRVRAAPTPPKPAAPVRDPNQPVVKALSDPENPLQKARPLGIEPVPLPEPKTLAPLAPALPGNSATAAELPSAAIAALPAIPAAPNVSGAVTARAAAAVSAIAPTVPSLPASRAAWTPLDPSASISRPAAVTTLLGAAEQAGKAGRRAEARAKLERGLEIAPRDGELWFRLAQLSAAEGDWKQAKSLAERASSLAASGSALASASAALGEQAAALVAGKH